MNNPLTTLDEWDDDVRRRYPEDGSDGFRDYSEDTRDGVMEFYRQNHIHQTVEFNRSIREKYLPPRTREMGLREAMDFLNRLVDDVMRAVAGLLTEPPHTVDRRSPVVSGRQRRPPVSRAQVRPTRPRTPNN